ncbi:MFS transporter [Lysobacter korlensis]|uniref:MFS transporter n=1 Tax=Lysobacter korlensis TaxID=553636 RepID=A0ABV6RVY6_9GAMM
MAATDDAFPWRSVALTAFLPALLFAIGEGAIIPIIPLVAGNLGASLAIAGFIAAALMIGELVGDIPSGWLVSRIGERPAMIGAAFASIVGLVICILAPNPWALGFGVLVIGMATAVFALARHAFMTSFVPLRYRARALSTLGGVFRAGFFVGPFLTAGAIAVTGDAASAFWIHIVACLASAAVLLVLSDPIPARPPVLAPDGRPLREGEALVEAEARGLWPTIAAKRGVLLRMGAGAAIISALRASRAVVLPLWGISIGIDAASIALIIGIAGGIDFALFYTSGQIMDRWGRMWSAMPSVVGMSLGHLVLAFTHDVPANVQWFIAMAFFLSVANGIGSGIVMTLGADLADNHDPAPFLGAWRFTSSLGAAASPLAVSVITALTSLSIAVAGIGVVGLAGAAVLARYVPRFAPHRGPG